MVSRVAQVGCPARGKMTAAGKCKDNGDPAAEHGAGAGRGSRALGEAFAIRLTASRQAPTSREAFGKALRCCAEHLRPCQEADDCLCVKAATRNGKLALSHRHLESVEGKALEGSLK